MKQEEIIESLEYITNEVKNIETKQEVSNEDLVQLTATWNEIKNAF